MPRSASNAAVASSIMKPCSMQRTPAATALWIVSDVKACTVTKVFQSSATSTAARSSVSERLTMSSGLRGDETPPPATSSIWRRALKKLLAHPQPDLVGAVDDGGVSLPLILTLGLHP